MRVLLLYPRNPEIIIGSKGLMDFEPLGLEYLAASIPEHEVKIIDLKFEDNFTRELSIFKPQIFGISGVAVHYYEMLQILELVKKYNKNTLTIVGGMHPSLVPSDFNNEYVDVVVFGHNVRGFRKIVQRFEKKQSFVDIAGIAIREEGQLRYTKPLALQDLNHLPIPNRRLAAKYSSKYRYLTWKGVNLLITSAGCEGSCIFCANRHFTQGKYLRRSPNLVIEELKRIESRYIFSPDDNFFYDPAHSGEIAQRIESEGIKKEYYVFSTSDSIVNNRKIVKNWAKIGLKWVFLGLEAVNDSELHLMGKHTNTETNIKSVNILHDLGLDVFGGFLIQPWYTKDDFKRIIEYMDRYNIFISQFTIITPFPGTPYYESQKEKFILKDYRFFDTVHSVFPTVLPSKQFYRQFLYLYLQSGSPLRALKLKIPLALLDMNSLKVIPDVLKHALSIFKAHQNVEAFKVNSPGPT
jgi:radical SAM superfamily enzyme YgiQ (UPF0313 family)